MALAVSDPRRPKWSVRHAEVLGGHRVRLTFADGTVGDVDLSDLPQRFAMLAPLRDEAVFARLRVRHGTLEWPGDLDIAPESLYKRAKATRIRGGATRGTAAAGR